MPSRKKVLSIVTAAVAFVALAAAASSLNGLELTTGDTHGTTSVNESITGP